MTKILEVKNINKKYQNKDGEILTLKDINFELEKGEFVSIIGPSRMWKINLTFNNCRIRKENFGANLYRRK